MKTITLFEEIVKRQNKIEKECETRRFPTAQIFCSSRVSLKDGHLTLKQVVTATLGCIESVLHQARIRKRRGCRGERAGHINLKEGVGTLVFYKDQVTLHSHEATDGRCKIFNARSLTISNVRIDFLKCLKNSILPFKFINLCEKKFAIFKILNHQKLKLL